MSENSAVSSNNRLASRNLARLAFAVAASAPLAGALLALVLAYTVFTDAIFLGPHPEQDSMFVPAGPVEILINTFSVAFTGLFAGALLGWPAMLVFGLPAHAFLIRRTSAKAWIYALAGALAGAAVGGLRFLMTGGAGTPEDAVFLLSIGALTGVLAALAFWLFRRPDKDAADHKA